MGPTTETVMKLHEGDFARPDQRCHTLYLSKSFPPWSQSHLREGALDRQRNDLTWLHEKVEGLLRKSCARRRSSVSYRSRSCWRVVAQRKFRGHLSLLYHNPGLVRRRYGPSHACANRSFTRGHQDCFSLNSLRFPSFACSSRLTQLDLWY